MPIRVTVYEENAHERTEEKVWAIHPDGMHTTIANALNETAPGATKSFPNMRFSNMKETAK